MAPVYRSTGGTGFGHFPAAPYTPPEQTDAPPDDSPIDPPVIDIEDNPNILDAIGYPAHTDITNVVTRSAPSNLLECFACHTLRELTFNRFLMHITAQSGVPSITVVLYQFAGGELNDGTSLVPQLLLLSNIPTAIGLQNITCPETVLERGFYWVGVGRFTAGGTTVEYACHQLQTNIVWTNPGIGGITRHFFTVASPQAPPASLNLGTGTVPTPGGAPVHRFLKV